MHVDGLRVNKDNQMIEARITDFEMKATQNRIVAWLAALVHSRSDQNFDEVKTTTNQLSEVARHKYTRFSLDRDLRDIRSATAVIQKGTKRIYCGIIDTASVDMDTGEVTLKLGADMKPYLLKLGETQQGFTSYMLDAFLKIKSTNSQRLFELLSQWKVKGSVRYELNDLRRKLSLCEEVKRGEYIYKYPNWKDFERRVLRQAEEDLCNAGMHVFYTPIKRGRSVTHVEFSMLSNKEGMENIKSNFPAIFTYPLSDFQRLRIVWSNSPSVVARAIIEYDRSNDIQVLKDLLPKSKNDFYKRFERIQKIEKDAKIAKTQDAELF